MKTINAYSFGELNQEAKDKALKDLCDINTDYEWHADLIAEWKEKLANVGFLNADISFSGFGSQGDGASFSADLDLNKVLEGKFSALREEDTDFRCLKLEGYSSYERYVFDQNNVLSSPESEELSERFIVTINKLHESLSFDIYKDLEAEYENRISDMAIIETIESNDFYFLEDGTMV